MWPCVFRSRSPFLFCWNFCQYLMKLSCLSSRVKLMTFWEMYSLIDVTSTCLEETAAEYLFTVSFIIWRPLWCGTPHLLLGVEAVRAVGFPWLSRAEGSFEGEEAERVQSIYSSKKILKWASLLFSSRAVSHQSSEGREEKGQIGSYVNVNEDQERCEGYNHRWTSATVDPDICIISSECHSLESLYESGELKNENDTALKAQKLEGHLIEFHIWYSSWEMLKYSHGHDMEYKGLQVITDFYVMKELWASLTLT